MKAVVQLGYGPAHEVLQLQEVPMPHCGDDEVLVRVRATSVHPDVWHVVIERPRLCRGRRRGLCESAGLGSAAR